LRRNLDAEAQEGRSLECPGNMTAPTVRLVGLDFGSTTTSGVVARATVSGGADRRSELADVTIEYRSEPIFTPFRGERIDDNRLADWLDRFSLAAGIERASSDLPRRPKTDDLVRPLHLDRGRHPMAGGAIVTGLAARASNARVVRQLVQARFGPTLIATADDPALESWLAFMANCRDLSLAQPDAVFLNLDIGGGTTNVALGQAGQVRSVGCYNLGARHVRFVPGTYRIAGLSDIGKRILNDLAIARRPGETLTTAELHRLLDFMTRALEALVQGSIQDALGPSAAYLETQPLHACAEQPIVTLSGGVGELIYRAALAGELPETTAYGDLGVDLAQYISQSSLLCRNLLTHTPAALGRATVLGLALHHVQLSGATLFLPDPAVLPLADLPIVCRLSEHAADEELRAALALVGRSAVGGCIALELADCRYQTIRSLGERLATALEAGRFPADRPLVLLMNQNAGKTLGQYATRWRRLSVTLIVLDELPDRGAAFATLGRPCDQLLPVSFYGL
jgi:ethanolamine utilization protein EutA